MASSPGGGPGSSPSAPRGFGRFRVVLSGRSHDGRIWRLEPRTIERRRPRVALREPELVGRERVVPVEHLVAKSSAAPARTRAPPLRGLEPDARHLEVPDVFAPAPLAPLGEAVPVELRQRRARQAAAQVQGVDVAADDVLHVPTAMELNERRVGEARSGAVEAYRGGRKRRAGLLHCPHPVRTAEVRDARGRRDTSARVHDRATRPRRARHHLRELIHLRALLLRGTLCELRVPELSADVVFPRQPLGVAERPRHRCGKGGR